MKLVSTMLIAAAALASASALALPTSQSEITYFSNASFKVEIGNEMRPSCNGGGSTLHGHRSRFAVRVSEPCQGGGRPSDVDCYVDGIRTTCPASICDSGIFDCG